MAEGLFLGFYCHSENHRNVFTLFSPTPRPLVSFVEWIHLAFHQKSIFSPFKALAQRCALRLGRHKSLLNKRVESGLGRPVKSTVGEMDRTQPCQSALFRFFETIWLKKNSPRHSCERSARTSIVVHEISKLLIKLKLLMRGGIFCTFLLW